LGAGHLKANAEKKNGCRVTTAVQNKSPPMPLCRHPEPKRFKLATVSSISGSSD